MTLNFRSTSYFMYPSFWAPSAWILASGALHLSCTLISGTLHCHDPWHQDLHSCKYPASWSPPSCMYLGSVEALLLHAEALPLICSLACILFLGVLSLSCTLGSKSILGANNLALGTLHFICTMTLGDLNQACILALGSQLWMSP